MRIKQYITDFLKSTSEFGFPISWRLYLKYRLSGIESGERDILISNDVAEYFWNHYSYLVNQKDIETEDLYDENNSPIWIFWWQGKDNMPKIVKACYNSICNNAPEKHPVVLLTKENYRQFAHLPEFIIKKAESKDLSLAHFSDIIRANLITLHGGLWLDATMFISKPIPEALFKQDFFSPIPYFRGKRYKDYSWCCFAWGGKKGNLVHGNLYKFFIQYWKDHQMLITYLWQDDYVKMMYNHFPKIREVIDYGGIPTTGLFEMQQVLGDPYDESYYKKLIKENTYHKLTYKRGNIIGKEIPTFYDHIVNEIK